MPAIMDEERMSVASSATIKEEEEIIWRHSTNVGASGEKRKKARTVDTS